MTNTNNALSQIAMDEQKKERLIKLFESFRQLDYAIEPFKEQKKELRSSYIENQWLTNEEFSLAKKAYNFLKSKVNIDDVATFIEAGKSAFPGEDE